MKQFFKFMFASFTGTLLTILVIFLIFAGLISSIVAMSENEKVTVQPNSVLQLNWTTPIVDRASDNPFDGFDFATMESKKPAGLNEILKTIEKAKNDSNIDGIFIDMESIPAGIATVEEIRDKLIEFKAEGKFILAYGNSYSQSGYYFASVADEIYLNPKGMVLFKGLNAELMFFKNMLEKLDIEMQVLRGPDNKYKSAVEPLIKDKMSESNREQYSTLLNSIWGKILIELNESRGLSIEDLNSIADNLEVTNAEKAMELNFVDGIVYRDEIENKLKELTGKSEDEKLAWITYSKYTKASVGKTNISRDRVAVIYASGDIKQGSSAQNSMGSKTIAKAIKKARTNDNVKAIVMRVNSPVGDALASDVIRREVALAKEAKPFIVSMGDLAASGGYWISTSADYIFAQPTTITGSIGVFGVIPNFQGLMTNKLGITFDQVSTNENSNYISVTSQMSDFQKEKLNAQIIDIYDDFIDLVSTTRGLKPEYVDSIAKGRVWSGTDALSIGLIDEIGGLEDAIAYAAEKADLGSDFRLKDYPERGDVFKELVSQITGEAKANIVADELGDYKIYYDQINTLKNMKGVQARLPYFYSIN
ncbi:MAG: signal peptide peptidase SppA [Marinilabiliales bacterium]|nr:MAG: signal peptide peptidase SppA [Marinilabiliales bacterium]